MSELEIISNNEIDAVWGNADFGKISRREVIKFALLKVASGYANGHTAECIIRELGLIGKAKGKKVNYITAKGRRYLWAAFGKHNF